MLSSISSFEANALNRITFGARAQDIADARADLKRKGMTL